MKPDDLWPGGPGLIELPAGTDVWELHEDGFWVLVPTNTCRKKNGSAVMGAGLARDAALRFPGLAARYGLALEAGQDRLAVPKHRLLLGPTKDDWRQPAKIDLVAELLDGVARWCQSHPGEAVAVPSPGCGNGGLPYPEVRAAAVLRLASYRVALLPPITPSGTGVPPAP